MQTSMLSSSLLAMRVSPTLAHKRADKPARCNRMVVRAEFKKDISEEASRTDPLEAARKIATGGPLTAADIDSTNDEKAYDLGINPLGWTRTQEVSNGRAALAGIVAAVASEVITHTSTLNQLFGGSANTPLARPLFAVVVLGFIFKTVTERSSTGRPPLTGNPNIPTDQAASALNLGRFAMVAFSAILLLEKFNGGNPLFG